MPAEPMSFQGFEPITLKLADSTIHAQVGTTPNKPALVLLHGFPQTHLMWRRVAQALSANYQIVMPDLRGYGQSYAHQPDAPDHSPHSKRAMANDVVALLDHLGIDKAYVCGHDRGGRVAHRLAIDHPSRVIKLCVIDIAPTLDMYNRTDMDFARAYYHWFHLIQPFPLPETMIGGAPRDYLHAKLGGWGSSGLGHLEPEALAAYEASFCKPAAIHSACEDYRASASIDLEHDRASRAIGQRIACDTMVIWGGRGIVNKFFDPITLWQAQCHGQVSGEVLPAGHFIPEECPNQTAELLNTFMQ